MQGGVGADASAERLADDLLTGRTSWEKAIVADPEALAWALKNICQVAWMNDPVRSRAAARCARALSERSPSTVVQALARWTAGIGALSDSRFNEALEQLQASTVAWNTMDRPLESAQASVAMLMPLALLGRFDEALATGQAAEARLTEHGDAQGAAKVALNLGSLALQRDRCAEATTHYRRAGIRFARLGDREHSVQADIGLADAMGYDGRIDEARLIYDRAEMRAQQHGFPVLAASAQHGRSLLALGRGRYREALSGLLTAQRAFARLEVDHLLVEVERDLADAYLDLRLLPEAIALYDTLALRLQEQGNEATLPWLLMQRARALAQAGRHAEAEETLLRAQVKFGCHDIASGAALAELAGLELVLVQNPDPSMAVACADRAESIAASLPQNTAPWARLLQAVACRMSRRPDLALALLRPLCDTGQASASPQRQARAWDEVGRANEAQGDVAAAAAAYEHAMAVFEEMRAALPGDDFQLASLADHLHPFEARLALALGALDESPESVLGWLDRYRARVLSERLGRGTDTARSLDDATQQNVGALRSRLNWIRRQERRRAEDGDDTLPTALLDEALTIEQELLESVRRARALLHPEADDAAVGVAAAGMLPGLDVAALRRGYTDGRALVVYGTTGDELMAVVVADGRIRLVRRLAQRAQIQGQLKRLHFQIDGLRAGVSHIAAHGPQLLERGTAHLQGLYRTIWAPLTAALGQATDVSVVPCDALQAIPFAALHDGERWLDEVCHLRLMPSAAMAIRRSATSAPAAEGSRRRVLVGESSGLPQVRAELEAAASALQPALVMLDEQAGVQATLDAFPHAEVLHLACHAEFRSDSPGFSALHLNDGLLTAAQIEEQRLTARLVVLSACDTGRAQAAPGDEGLGLVRAFLVAGAQEVVASLWAVDDEATADLMGHFYRRWCGNGQRAALALQEARADLRRTHPHPYHWGAFVLHGIEWSQKLQTSTSA